MISYKPEFLSSKSGQWRPFTTNDCNLRFATREEAQAYATHRALTWNVSDIRVIEYDGWPFAVWDGQKLSFVPEPLKEWDGEEWGEET